MLNIDAVLFDLDGVIVSTDRLHCLAWKELFDRIGVKFDAQDNARIKGLGRRESFEAIAGHGFSHDDVESLLERKNSRYLSLINGRRLRPLPGVRRFLRQLDRMGIKKAVVSGSKNAVRILQNLGIGERFDVIVDGTMCSKGKPAPELFLLAAERLGVQPSRCVVIEDAQAGIDAARNAKMRSVGIGAGLLRSDLPLADTRLLDVRNVIMLNRRTCGCKLNIEEAK